MKSTTFALAAAFLFNQAVAAPVSSDASNTLDIAADTGANLDTNSIVERQEKPAKEPAAPAATPSLENLPKDVESTVNEVLDIAGVDPKTLDDDKKGKITDTVGQILKPDQAPESKIALLDTLFGLLGGLPVVGGLTGGLTGGEGAGGLDLGGLTGSLGGLAGGLTGGEGAGGLDLGGLTGAAGDAVGGLTGTLGGLTGGLTGGVGGNGGAGGLLGGLPVVGGLTGGLGLRRRGLPIVGDLLGGLLGGGEGGQGGMGGGDLLGGLTGGLTGGSEGGMGGAGDLLGGLTGGLTGGEGGMGGAGDALGGLTGGLTGGQGGMGGAGDALGGLTDAAGGAASGATDAASGLAGQATGAAGGAMGGKGDDKMQKRQLDALTGILDTLGLGGLLGSLTGGLGKRADAPDAAAALQPTPEQLQALIPAVIYDDLNEVSVLLDQLDDEVPVKKDEIKKTVDDFLDKLGEFLGVPTDVAQASQTPMATPGAEVPEVPESNN